MAGGGDRSVRRFVKPPPLSADRLHRAEVLTASVEAWLMIASITTASSLGVFGIVADEGGSNVLVVTLKRRF